MRTPQFRASRSHRILSLLLSLALGVSAVRADYSIDERSERERQLKQLSRITEHAVRRSPEASVDDTAVLLGMLILRDDAPEKSAMCASAVDRDDYGSLQRHFLRCERCRKLETIVARGVVEMPAAGTAVRRGGSELLDEARALVDDGHGYVRMRTELGRELERALELLTRRLDSAPDDPDALQLFAVLSELKGRSCEAEAALRKAVQVDLRAPGVLHNVALLYLRHGFVRHAHAVLEFALRRMPRYDTARLLAWLRRSPGGQALVTHSDAIAYLEWAVAVESSREKVAADRVYLDLLRREQDRDGIDSHRQPRHLSGESWR